MDEPPVNVSSIEGKLIHPASEKTGDVASLDDDGQAIAQTLTGDNRAFESVVTRHERAVYIMLLRMTGNADDAQELAQEAFLRAFRSLKKFQTGRPFRPWILRIAANAAYERSRKTRKALVVSLNEEPETIERLGDPRVSHPAGNIAEEQERLLLRKAVDSLRDRDAELFHLHYDEEMSVEEIARTTGRRANTVSVALHRLRQQIKGVVESLTGKDV